MGRTFSRRELLGNAAKYGAGAMALGTLGDPVHLARLLEGQKTAQQRTANTSSPSLGPIVLCTMYGGYDGLNVACPYENAAYLSARPTMSVADSVQVISSGELGLHPAMTGIYALYNAGQVAVIQGIGYPNPNYSHFSSMAIWMAGTTDLSVYSGWAGRWLDGLSPDPLTALSIGGVVPQLLTGNVEQASAVSDTDVSANQTVPGGSAFEAAYNVSQNPAATSTAMQAAVAQSGANLVTVATEAANALSSEAPLKITGRNGGDFGQQLSIIGQLILAGSPTQVYQASMGGFDTHSNELNAQASLFAQVDAAVTAFFTGLGNNPAAAGTVLVLYSEFGRQLKENGSVGTDHGNGNTIFVIGPQVKGGLYGEYPSLTSLDRAGALVQNVDFRQVWAELIDSVLGASSSSILGGSFSHLGFL